MFSGVATITYTISDTHVTSHGTLSVLVGEDNVAPVVATPKVAFGSGRVDHTAPLKISWHATDLGTGVKTYKVQVRVGSGDWKTISKGKATSITKHYPFKKDLTFRVKATDKVGNASHWVQSATRRITRFKHTSGSVDYTGSWTKVTGAHKYAFTTGKDKTARLTFTGRSDPLRGAQDERLGLRQGLRRRQPDRALQARAQLVEVRRDHRQGQLGHQR